MTDKAISPLRRRMIDDMTMRGFTASTQRGYLASVVDFTKFLGRSPDQAGAEDLRRYQLRMRSRGASAATMNAAVSALRFFFGATLGRRDDQVALSTVRAPRWLPVILSPAEVARLLDGAANLKYKAASIVPKSASKHSANLIRVIQPPRRPMKGGARSSNPHRQRSLRQRH